jgi:hypothetical protein
VRDCADSRRWFRSGVNGRFRAIWTKSCRSGHDNIADIGAFRQTGSVTLERAEQRKRVEGIGCSWALLALNLVLMGLAASSFAQGPYSSIQQELWYRYGSLGLLLAGALLPAFALIYGRHSFKIAAAASVWMILTLLAFVWFAMMSGGGV